MESTEKTLTYLSNYKTILRWYRITESGPFCLNNHDNFLNCIYMQIKMLQELTYQLQATINLYQ